MTIDEMIEVVFRAKDAALDAINEVIDDDNDEVSERILAIDNAFDDLVMTLRDNA